MSNSFLFLEIYQPPRSVIGIAVFCVCTATAIQVCIQITIYGPNKNRGNGEALNCEYNDFLLKVW